MIVRHETGAAPSPTATRRAVVSTACGAVAVAQMATTIYLPGMPALGADSGADDGTLQLSVAVFVVFAALPVVAWGRAAERFGRVPAFVAAGVCFVLASAALALITSAPELLGLRVVQAVGAGGIAVIVMIQQKSAFIFVDRFALPPWVFGLFGVLYGAAYLGGATYVRHSVRRVGARAMMGQGAWIMLAGCVLITAVWVVELPRSIALPQSARTVVDDVDFDLFAGETLGIVGESGSGKTTTARLALRLITPSSGRVVVDGHPWSEYSERELRPLRGAAQLIAQDPPSSFDPRYTVERVIGESLDTVDVRGAARNKRVREILDAVGLTTDLLDRHPRTLSGGQRQRIAIARALAPNPALLVADEPVSALDVSVQAQILDLLADLQADFGTALLLISHDLGMIHHAADRVLVMKNGQIVESGEVDTVLRNPQHDYTRRLIASVPRLPEPNGRT